MIRNLLKPTLIIVSSIIVFQISLLAQVTEDLYKPREYTEALLKNSRSVTGEPGANYFQNRADYEIKAEFAPNTKILTGKETITYKNNSNNQLQNLCFNLYQNIYKVGASRDIDLTADDLTDGMEITGIKINGKAVDNKAISNFSTLLVIELSEIIDAQTTTKIEIEWKLSFPKDISYRIGTYDESNFFIGYWFPKICVYDDLVNWNLVAYTGFVEFYNEYGNYNVEITVPADYNVWSSGLLQNADEIYTEKYLEKIKSAAQTDEIVNVITSKDRSENKITKAGKKHTWKFKAEYMPDFALAISNKYLWDATSVKVGDKRVLVNALYNPKAKTFQHVAEICRKAINFYSTEAIAIPFPYPQLTAFHGDRGGMEFPGMVNDKDMEEIIDAIHLTTHEVAHSYFPFNVGTNEQKYAWIDEGLITFMTQLAQAKILDDKNFVPFANIINDYNQNSASLALETPLMTASENVKAGYQYSSYTKSATAFYLLYKYLGEQKFFAALQEFTKRWKQKHPTPYDLFNTFNSVVGEDLAWFWKPWFFELGYPDLELGEISEKTDKIEITILRKGMYPTPINLLITYKDGKVETLNKSLDIWKTGINSITVELPKGDMQEISLDTKLTPDSYNRGNLWTAFHKVSEELMQSYVGKYGPRNIILENGQLYYQRTGGAKMKMIALEDNFFRFNELDYFKLRILKDNGKVVALEGVYSDGRTDRTEREAN